MAEPQSQTTMGFGSCATLEDGIDHVCKGNQVKESDSIPEDEEALLRELEDSWVDNDDVGRYLILCVL